MVDVHPVTVSGQLTDTPGLGDSAATARSSIPIAHNERFKNSAGGWVHARQDFAVAIWGGLGDWTHPPTHSTGQHVVASRPVR